MKKIFKNLLLSTAILPCAFLAVACNKNSEPPAPSAEKVAYTTLQNHLTNQSFFDLENSSSVHLTATNTNKEIVRYNFDNCGVTGLELSALKNMCEESLIMEDYVSELGYSSNGTGYHYNYSIDETGKKIDDSQRVVVNDNSNYYAYNCRYSGTGELERISRNNVDSGYALNELYYSRINEITNQVEDYLFTSVPVADSFDEYKYFATRDFVKLMRNTLIENISLPSLTEVDVNLNVLSNNNYSITSSLFLDNYNEKFELDEDKSVEVIISLNYDNNFITSVTMQITESEYEKVLTSNYLSNPDLTSDDYVIKINQGSFRSRYEFNKPFNNSLINQSFQGFEDRGNIDYGIDAYFIGIDTRIFTMNKVIYGDNVLDFVDSLLSTYHNLTLEGVYWDKEMTQLITTTDTFPSFSKPIYIKVAPDEGYAFVSVEHRNSNSGTYGKEVVEINQENYKPSKHSSFGELISMKVNGITVNYENGVKLESGKIYNIILEYED